MDYYIATSVSRPFDSVVTEVIDRLKSEDFDVLSTIDLAATLRARLGARIPRYFVLGVCNAQLACEALEFQGTLGVLLPCHVIIRETNENWVEIASVDPIATVDRGGNTALARIALEVRNRLSRVVEGIAHI